MTSTVPRVSPATTEEAPVSHRRLLMCAADYFRIDYEINPYMHVGVQPDVAAAVAEHDRIVAAHLAAGRKVEFVDADPGCPDMTYTANAAVVRGDRAVLATLPPERAAETPHHRAWLEENGFDVAETPYAFSGQGDALACGDLLLSAHGQRTDFRALDTLSRHLGYEVVALRTTSPQWYDLDLAVAVIHPGRVLAYNPQALDAPSLRTLRGLGMDLIEVAPDEAAAFALNLISDGRTVTMTSGAPRLAADLRSLGLTVVQLDTTELRKGGGGIRCTALTLDNPA
ncbi:dimethylarginine dimethylaminohydrolase family protein [Amycolatopsis sp. WQ 127309]|uniref:dimethylarginine dimethylaminohydrolase family protein n=1 Tax=Amycolatopsis sp. WQ 127309 TaxID=2932773 RepID=UPI001FF1170B|nr:arginine deiminase-related protein [Amycolatopsis sp. WQ 127309]UOZ02766.1 arginine deiminase-related protein [Amycolatopsis sp. WQ 127309]